MGTWGAGAFENDGASDWAMELQESSSPAPVKRALTRVAKRKAGTEIDLDDALEALAAADIVAAARGHASPKLPDELGAWIAACGFTPSDEQTAGAIIAVQRIAEHSELKSEWNGAKAWLREQEKLIQRLQKPAKPVRRATAPATIIQAPTEPPPDAKSAALERALKKLKLRVCVNGDGDPREIVPVDTPTIGDADMHLLAPLRTLEGFHLSDSKITDAAAEYLRGLPKLAWAWLMETRVGDRVAEALASASPRLRDLNVEETRITDRGVRHLARLGKLRELNLRGTAVTDAGIAHLAALPDLRVLMLGRTRVTGAAFSKFADNSRLERLDLSDTRATDASLASIARFRRLEGLWLTNTPVSDAGVPHLVKLKRLNVLDLDGTRITDASLPHLARMKRLRTLYLADTKITRAGIDRLRKELPAATIDVE